MMTRASIVTAVLTLLVHYDLIISSDEESRYYTVIPSPGDPCNETEQCLTLSQFAENISDYLSANTIIHFLQGEYHLDSTIMVENLITLSMSSHDNNVTIVCNHSWPSTQLEFSNMNVVHISGLTLIGCTESKFINVNQFILEDSQFIGDKGTNGTALELIETSAMFIRTKLNNNCGNRMISLYCENEDVINAWTDFLHNYNTNEEIEVSATAGGAIVSTHSNVTIVGSVFEGNSAQAGGAIFAELQSNITIINSTFVGNQATPLQSHQHCYTGGGVLYSNSGSSVIVHNSVFEYNTAYWFGGVMATGFHSNEISITNSSFISNAAHFHGGVLSSANHSIITITDSEFSNNNANYRSGVLDLSGHSKITITNSEFTNNSANDGSDRGFLVYFIFLFKNSVGGVLSLMVAHHSSITITDSKFANNHAINLGGVIYLFEANHSSITITNSEFIHNSANWDGGVLHMVHADHSNITVTDSEFIHNSANWDGGVLCLSGPNHLSITNSEFIHNSANRNGGVLDLFHANHSTITITNSDFTRNIAKVQGGIIDASNSQNTAITISHSNLTNNSAMQGGIVSCTDIREFFHHNIINIIVIVMASKFVNNTAYEAGGILNTLHADVFVTQSAFLDNEARDGGTMHIEDGVVTINCSQFHHNVASFGGVLWTQDTKIISHDTSLSHNSANTNGGVLYAKNSTILISRANFSQNRALGDGGTIHTQVGTVTIIYSKFDHNVANVGGVLWVQYANIKSHDTNLSHNKAYTDGGILYAQNSTTIITGTNFSHNRADNNGGTMYTDRVTTFLIDCSFNHNIAGNDGGVLRSYLSYIDITESEYSNNSANNEGGVFHIDQTNLVINRVSFTYSKARDGGVIWTDQGVLKIDRSSFTDNNASAGGILWAEQANIDADRVKISYNYASIGVVYLLESNSYWSDILYSDNIGSLYVFGGAVNIRNNSKLVNNTQPSNRHPLLKEGGTITIIQSEIKFDGKSILTKGHAECGGAVKAIESKVYVHGNVTIANNTATEAGGGIYLYHSDLTCWKNSSLNVWKNVAKEKGGGISATGSVIKVKNPLVTQTFSSLHFDSNEAMNGGGLFLEMDTKVYVFKSKIKTPLTKAVAAHQRLISFSLNSAQYGGAIYVSDNGICGVSMESTVNECFIQAIAMYAPMSDDFDPDDTRCQNIDFVNNTARISGNSLFGGLLDRCTVSQFAETNINNVNMDYTLSNGTMVVQGYEYFQKISNVQDTDIDSPPVRVCFCTNGQPNCSQQHDPIQVRIGVEKNISLSLAIVNQIHDPLQEATILSHFQSGNYLCQNHIQSMDGSCSDINFAVFSHSGTEELILSLDEGPCKDAPESKARVIIEFLCPQCLIGFELDESEEGCRCVCDSQLFPYFTNCSGETLIRERNVWITNLTTNHTSDTHQYLLHPNCPFDYCHPPSSRVEINLNIPNGADVQCANHRAGLLCGTCQQNFSLSLGSSHCLPCSTHWYAVLIAILIAAILAGIVLVALLLALNLTVATGTLNGIIFYANIVYANNSVFLPFTEQFNFITAFISWLNLEIGFDMCFFVGMDAYSKTLLQLTFPGYIFFLVFMVIIISKHSMRFSQLIGKRNPVATLATLIFLSYAIFLHIIIASLSFAVLKFPDGSRAYVWLVDASVGYLSGKHIALFIIALLIIIAGVCYTALLLFWQWLLHHQDKTLFSWTKYQKLCHFIEPYHAPYVDKHRYWAGLLFLVRVVLYIVFALNVNGDPHVSLVAIILTIGGLLLTKGFLIQVYKNWPIDVMESIMYFNILGFAALTWYFIGTPRKQRAVAYTSVVITFLFMLMVIAVHVSKFTPLGSVIQKTKIFKVLAAKILNNKKAIKIVDQNPIEHEHREQEVTFSVVEVPKPILERPEPEVHIQIRPQELQCYTPANSIEEQQSEMQEHNNK